MFKVLARGPANDPAGFTPFQALCTSLTSRVGTGNLAGVAVATILGGLSAPWAAIIFSICLIIAFGFVFNEVQSNSIAEAVSGASNVPQYWVGIAVAALSGIVIFGGINSIAACAQYVVPFMAGTYLLVSGYVLIVNIDMVPAALMLIIKSALAFLKCDNIIGLSIARIGLMLMVLWGSYETATNVFNAADATMGLMATINLIAIGLLSPIVMKLTRDYFAQRKTHSPTFDPRHYPELQGKIDTSIWTDVVDRKTPSQG